MRDDEWVRLLRALLGSKQHVGLKNPKIFKGYCIVICIIHLGKWSAKIFVFQHTKHSLAYYNVWWGVAQTAELFWLWITRPYFDPFSIPQNSFLPSFLIGFSGGRRLGASWKSISISKQWNFLGQNINTNTKVVNEPEMGRAPDGWPRQTS